MNPAQAPTVEIDLGSASTRGRPPSHHWMVRLRRGDRAVIVAVGLTQSAAAHLATRIAEVLDCHQPASGNATQTTASTENRCPPTRISAVRQQGHPKTADKEFPLSLDIPGPPLATPTPGAAPGALCQRIVGTLGTSHELSA